MSGTESGAHFMCVTCPPSEPVSGAPPSTIPSQIKHFHSYGKRQDGTSSFSMYKCETGLAVESYVSSSDMIVIPTTPGRLLVNNRG